MAKQSKKIIVATNLQTFFYDQLNEINKKSLLPISDSLIFYSSEVLNSFSRSEKYFEEVQGRLKEKVLGYKLLEAEKYSIDDRKKILKDIGDTTLILCGHFKRSVKEKLLNVEYYKDIGKNAYAGLNSLWPSFLDIPDFYMGLAGNFEVVTTMISSVSTKNNQDSAILEKYSEWLETKSEDLKKELQILGAKIDDGDNIIS